MHRSIFLSLVPLFLSACQDVKHSGGGALLLRSTPDYEIPGLPDHETPGFDEVRELASEGVHVCARMANNRVKCWGDNLDGQCDLSAARNASKKIIDARKARFSKISVGPFYTCGILQEPGYEDIPVCFGREGEYLNVPNEKVKDLEAGPFFTCFIKMDGTLGCVGPPVQIDYFRSIPEIAAKDLPLHGIDAHHENLDFSRKTFTRLKLHVGRVCGQSDDGIVYCMGGNYKGAGIPINQKAVDFYLEEERTYYISEQGFLIQQGMQLGFNTIKKIADPEALKYKKILQEVGLLTAAGNHYDDGSPIPENTLIPYVGETEEGVLTAVEVRSSRTRELILIRCVLKENHKVACRPSSLRDVNHPQTKSTPIINDLPKEIAY